MSKIAVIIETLDNQPKPANFGLITAALAGGGNEVYAFVLNASADAVKDSIQQYGAQKIVEITADGGDLTKNPELQAAAVADAVKELGISAVLGISSPAGRDLLGRLAALLDAPLVLDSLSVDLESATVRKSHFSGKTFATIKLSGGVILCGIRPNVIEEIPAPCEATTMVFESHSQDFGRMHVLEVKHSDSKVVDLTEATIIITGGSPIGSKENFDMLEDAAQALGGAAVGASRAAVDAGFASHSMQVGQTGKTVSPKLYIGCGLSGSVQHFAGMKTSKIIVGINTDRDAPIFSKCDYGIIGDLFDVVPALTEALREVQ